MLRLLQLLLVLILLAAATVLGLLVVHVWWADFASLEYLRRDVAYGWLLIQAAPLIGIACGIALAGALGGLLLLGRHARANPASPSAPRHPHGNGREP